jgi:acyl-CoA reductase-like NAD-dependent aldehyde dehydrogenase
MATVEQQAPAVSNGAAHHGEGIPVENPATGEILRTVPDLDAGALAEIASRARAAQPQWQSLGFEGRGRVLRRMQKWVVDNAQRINETVVSETGKTFEDAQTMEVSAAASYFYFWAKNAKKYLADERVRTRSPLLIGKKLVLRYKPRGLIGVIAPWNYPFANCLDCVPALAAGNSVILKPSEITPLSSLLFEQGLRECGIPEDVFQVATGRGETGAALIEEVDMIMFTGSTRTGRKVAEAAGRRLIPSSLELGGKDPMIVLADADLERAANTATYYSMMNSGQTCIAIERVYVEAPVYDEFLAKVTAKVRALRQGAPGGGPGSIEVGSMIFPPQVDIVEDHVNDALAKGAKAIVGGSRGEGPGHFFEPTLLVDVDHSMKIMQQETFGPTLPIMKVKDAEEALRLANDTSYGLGGSVFSRDSAKGRAIAERVDSGAVCVNDACINLAAAELPMGGVKESGVGHRNGAGGIRKYCSQQALLITPRLALKRDLHFFPYTTKGTQRLGKAVKLLYGRGKRT